MTFLFVGESPSLGKKQFVLFSGTDEELAAENGSCYRHRDERIGEKRLKIGFSLSTTTKSPNSGMCLL